ncbi:hypothetical protein LX64_05020 [Chitinophaga skermanii]|uniref:Uncharacterized protein n=1 Tax=Chitinophaga skermanii TaxID=331697 RepID=A0A327Q7A7_9BACT|nr:hypothetical protein [Chitinophaga skermanii]RAI97716.1 hypothetical protein LX64_05020 [Chitinophaga skermanii]
MEKILPQEPQPILREDTDVIFGQPITQLEGAGYFQKHVCTKTRLSNLIDVKALRETNPHEARMIFGREGTLPQEEDLVFFFSHAQLKDLFANMDPNGGLAVFMGARSVSEFDYEDTGRACEFARPTVMLFNYKTSPSVDFKPVTVDIDGRTFGVEGDDVEIEGGGVEHPGTGGGGGTIRTVNGLTNTLKFIQKHNLQNMPDGSTETYMFDYENPDPCNKDNVRFPTSFKILKVSATGNTPRI